MSEAYASNAEGVKDYLKNYTDEQINSVGEMVSNENNMAMNEWREKAEAFRSAKSLKLQESGETLGGIIGVKGIGKGISKVREIYKKGQEAKKTAQELAEKTKKALGKGKEATEKIKNDLEEQTKSSNQKAKEENEGEDDYTPDVDEDPDAYYSTPPDEEEGEDSGSKNVDDGEGDTTDPIGETGGEPDIVGETGGDSATDIDSVLSKIADARARAKKALDDDDDEPTADPEDDSGEPPSTEQEGQQGDTTAEPTADPDPAPTADPDPAPTADPDPEPTADPDPAPTTDPDPVETSVDDIGDSAGSLNEYASKVIGRIAQRGRNIRNAAEGTYKAVKKKITEKPDQDGDGGGGDDDENDGAAEEEEEGADLGVETGEEVGLGVADVVVGAIPVVGEIAAVGYAVGSFFEDLFGGSSSPPPPKTKVVGTTLAGGNPLDMGGGQFSNALSSGVATTESAQDEAGSLSF